MVTILRLLPFSRQTELKIDWWERRLIIKNERFTVGCSRCTLRRCVVTVTVDVIVG